MAFTTAFVFFHPEEMLLFLLEVFSFVKVLFIIKFSFAQPVSFWFMDTFFLKLFVSVSPGFPSTSAVDTFINIGIIFSEDLTKHCV